MAATPEQLLKAFQNARSALEGQFSPLTKGLKYNVTYDSDNTANYTMTEDPNLGYGDLQVSKRKWDLADEDSKYAQEQFSKGYGVNINPDRTGYSLSDNPNGLMQRLSTDKQVSLGRIDDARDRVNYQYRLDNRALSEEAATASMSSGDYMRNLGRRGLANQAEIGRRKAFQDAHVRGMDDLKDAMTALRTQGEDVERDYSRQMYDYDVDILDRLRSFREGDKDRKFQREYDRWKILQEAEALRMGFLSGYAGLQMDYNTALALLAGSGGSNGSNGGTATAPPPGGWPSGFDPRTAVGGPIREIGGKAILPFSTTAGALPYDSQNWKKFVGGPVSRITPPPKPKPAPYTYPSGRR